MAGETRSVVVRLSADVSGYIGQMQAAQKATDAATRQMGGAVARQSAALDDLGGKAGKVGLAAGAGLAVMGAAAVQWESQWAGVSKTVDGTATQMNGLESDLRELAKTMPATHQEIAATAEAAGQLGIARADITDFTKTMLELGETTNLTSEDAATSIAQISNVLQTAPDDVDNFAAALVDLGNKGASTESQILDMATRVAGAGATIGASEQDVLALSASMANLGIQSELGGGAMQRILTMINSDVASGSDAVEAYAKVAGVSADSFARSWSERPVEAFDLLVQGLGRIRGSGGDVASILEQMGIKGTQNLQVMLRMAGASDGLTKSLMQSGDAWTENSALVDEFAKRLGTTAAEVQIAWNNIKDAAIQGGQILLPIISDAAGYTADLAEAFNELPGPVQDFATAGLAVTALLGGGLWFGAKVVNGITTAKASLAALRPEITRVGTDLATRSGVRQFTSDLAVMATTSRTAGATTERQLARTQAAAARVRSTLATVGTRGGGLLAGLTLATTDLADGMSLSNTMSYALMGTIAGPWGAAIGGGIGLIKDFRAESQNASGAIDAFNDSLKGTDFTAVRSSFEALQQKTADLRADLHDVSGIGDIIGDSVAGWTDVFGTGLTDINDASAESVTQLTNLTGVLQGVAQANNDFIASADNGLANLPYGDLDDLARVAEKVQPVLDDLGYTFDDLLSMKPGSAEAVTAIKEINDALAFKDSDAGRIEAVGAAVDGLGGEMESTADQAKALKDALDDLLDPGLNLSATTDEWTASLRSLNDDLAKGSKAIVGNSDAALKNRDAIRERVGQLKDVLVAEAENGASSDQLAKKYRQQRKALLDAADAAGVSRDALKDYLEQIGFTPGLVRTIIQAETSQAMSAMDQVKRMLDQLDGKRAQTVVETVYLQTNKPKATPGSPDGLSRAGGGPIYGPGTKTSDSVPVMASRGEFMMSAAAVDHYGLDTMFALNARHLASGGSVDGIKPQGTLDDRLAIAQALQSIRDLTRELNERVKKGKNKGDLATVGIDRQLLQLQLQSARADLRAAQTREKREQAEAKTAADEALREQMAAADEKRRAVAEAQAGLDLSGGLTPTTPLTAGQQAGRGVLDTLQAFRDQVEEAGGTVGKDFGALAIASALLTSRYEDNASSIADLTSQMDSVRSGAAGSFMSDAFGGGLAAFDRTVGKDTANADAMANALATAAGNGLDGPLAAALAQSGNLRLAQEFAGLDATGIAAREASYAARDAAGDRLGQMAVDVSGLAGQVATLTTQNQDLLTTVQGLEASIRDGVSYMGQSVGTAVGQQINTTATNAARGKPKKKVGRG